MRIKRFAVSGFKNFTQEVVLDDMGEICVIHGENNVGKSNLLEAMQLFFKLLLAMKRELYENMNNSEQIISVLKEIGFEPNSIFHLVSPDLIELQLTFLITPEEVENLGAVLLSSSHRHVREQECAILLKIQIFPKISKITQSIDNPLENWFIERDLQPIHAAGINRLILDFLPENLCRPIHPSSDERFILIGTDRRISFDEVEVVREIIPQPLRLQLYDIRDSFEPMIAKRWKLFVKTMSRFNDILGEGEFVALYDRRANKADLVFDTGDKRIPINLLGSGIQQVVALIARLLVSNASFVAIEEPELNLRYTLQERLYEVFKEIVADPAGPSQIFLTSHSPAFEHGEHFYHMRQTEHGVTVEKRPISQARMVTGMNCDESLAGKSAPYSYVTSEGLVRLPESVLKDLDIPYGGGVFILKRKDNEHVELLTDEQYFNLFESADAKTSEHE